MQLALAGAMAITFSDCGKEGHDKANCWKASSGVASFEEAEIEGKC